MSAAARSALTGLSRAISSVLVPSVFANGRSIIHAGDGLKHVAAPPDVCKTPSPGGPAPIPYVNVASDSDLAKGTKNVTIEGNPVALASAHLSTSTGDEPGTAGGGIISAKTKGAMKWSTTSADVRFEGKGVARFMDITLHNGNSYNDAFKASGGTGLAYADDFTEPCEICKKGPREHRVLETPNSVALCADILAILQRRFARARDRGRYARSKKKRWSGYMVGVMVCKCGQSFAAMSGQDLEGFLEVAADVVDNVIRGGAVSLMEMVDANSSKAAERHQKKRALGGAWMRVRDKNNARESGYNPPGNCAGAKLMARAGHAPLQMTERFFSPGDAGEGWSAEYRLLVTKRSPRELDGLSKRSMDRLLSNAGAEATTREFTGNYQSVASCHSCQELLYMTNCPERTC